MRTIKFRCWVPDRSRSTGEILQWLMIAGVEDDLRYYSQKEGAIIMQFTGILDKNGKEIYEGDIVKVWDMNKGCSCDEEFEEDVHGPDCENYVCTQEIKWSRYCGYFCDEDTGNGCMPLGCDEFVLEIIGNLYENPDLLGGEGK